MQGAKVNNITNYVKHQWQQTTKQPYIKKNGENIINEKPRKQDKMIEFQFTYALKAFHHDFHDSLEMLYPGQFQMMCPLFAQCHP